MWIGWAECAFILGVVAFKTSTHSIAANSPQIMMRYVTVTPRAQTGHQFEVEGKRRVSERRKATLRALDQVRAEMESAQTLASPQTIKSASQGTSDFTAEIKLECLDSTVGLSVRDAVARSSKLFRRHGLPTPSKSAISNWRNTRKRAELAVVQATREAGKSMPEPKELQAAVLAALSDRRADASGRQVPQDVIDHVATFMEDMEAAKVPVTRQNVRVEFLAAMEQMYPGLCKKNGGWFNCSEDFLRSFESSKGYSRRRVTTGADGGRLHPSLTPEIMRTLFQARVASVAHQPDSAGRTVPAALAIGADETGVHLVPRSSVVLAKKGSRAVAREDFQDKRQITAMVAHTMDGRMLPVQLVFAGKSLRVLPTLTSHEVAEYRPLLCATENHWSNDESIKLWVERVVVPFLLRRKRVLKLKADHPSMLVWDVHWSHRHASTRELISKEYPWLRLMYVPARTTSFLQVADVAINAPLKRRVEDLTRQWRIDERKKSKEIVRSVPLLRLQVSRSILRAAAGISADIIMKGVESTGLAAVFDPARAPEVLAMAAELKAGGYLWQATSRNDVVCPGGLPLAAIMPYLTQGQDANEGTPIGDEGTAACTGTTPAMSATSAPRRGAVEKAAGGAKRGRQYTCGWCRACGHTAEACPERLAGHPAHPQARKSVRSKFQRQE